jgi:hypothetical protein
MNGSGKRRKRRRTKAAFQLNRLMRKRAKEQKEGEVEVQRDKGRRSVFPFTVYLSLIVQLR